MAAPRPRPDTQPGLLDDEDPGKWDRVKQALWETNLNAPIRGIYSLMNADPHTLYTDEGAAGQQAVADSFDAAGGVTAGSAMIPKPANSLTMGIKAYHGSPHSFDKFSMDKIGTGEGAQAYGHGLYFAENEGVAKGYRDNLTDPSQVKIRINDKNIPSVWTDDLRSTFPELYKGLKPDDQDVMDSLLGTMEGSYSVEDAARAAESVGGRAKSLFNQRVKPYTTKPDLGPGSMYEVDINADPNAFLDWDKPLTEQPNKIARSAVEAELSRYLGPSYDGQYPNFEKRSAGEILGDVDRNQVLQAERLREAGIPGIKYLDAGSRQPAQTTWDVGAPREEFGPYSNFLSEEDAIKHAEMLRRQGFQDAEIKKNVQAEKNTSNYVVFDDSLINIIKKYGLAGLLGGGAAANELMSQPQEQY